MSGSFVSWVAVDHCGGLSSGGGEDHGAPARDRDRPFLVGRGRAVGREYCPTIVKAQHVRPAQSQKRLDGEGHPGPEEEVLVGCGRVCTPGREWAGGWLVEGAADPVPGVVGDQGASGAPGGPDGGRCAVGPGATGDQGADGCLERGSRGDEKAAYVGRRLSDGRGAGG